MTEVGLWELLVVKATLSLLVASAGLYQMKLTKGESGIGWVVLGLLVLWM
jgi:hypothetical protein